MAKLINGNGNKAIWAAQDADLIASICGNITSIAAVGSQFSFTQEDANTIGVSDGVIITKEGRRIQLDTGAIDLFTIPTGVLGATSYYIIGYKLVQAADTVQTCETFVQKMDNSTDVIPEDTFKGGATEVYVSVYRVTQDGMNIDSVDLLLPKLSNIVQLISDLTASNDQNFKFDYSGGKYGYKINGTFYPFKGDLEETVLWTNPSPTSGMGATTVTLSQSIANFKYIKITGRNVTSASVNLQAVYSQSYVAGTSSSGPAMSLMYSFSDTSGRVRNCYRVSNTTIRFTTGYDIYAGHTWTESSAVNIPYQIIGLK